MLDLLGKRRHDYQAVKAVKLRNDSARDLILRPAVGVGNLNVQMYKNLTGHGASSVGVPHHAQPALRVKVAA